MNGENWKRSMLLDSGPLTNGKMYVGIEPTGNAKVTVPLGLDDAALT
jgi:hypothetical protein